MALFLFLPLPAYAQVCGSVPIEFEKYSDPMNRCSNSLSYDEAIDCVNDLRKKVETQKQREESLVSQAECLCNKLSDLSGGYPPMRYRRILNGCIN